VALSEVALLSGYVWKTQLVLTNEIAAEFFRLSVQLHLCLSLNPKPETLLSTLPVLLCIVHTSCVTLPTCYLQCGTTGNAQPTPHRHTIYEGLSLHAPDQGCQIFFVAYGQNPVNKWPKWLFFDNVMAKITKCFNYGNFHIHRCLKLFGKQYIFCRKNVVLP